MCGIAGYKTEKRIDGAVLEQMLAALVHRGPDAQGVYHMGGYSARMRRLKINDLATGNQPLFNQDKSIVLFYNGEIYNAPQLRRELEYKGYRFRTHSDGEVICHLYDEYGADLFKKLDGMFAAAIWTEKAKKLILARDMPGEKPLYFVRLPANGIVFASEIKSLKKFPGIDLSLSGQAIWDLPTFLWVPQPGTIYSAIEVLMPGHLLIADGSDLSIKPYAEHLEKNDVFISQEEAIRQTRGVVEKAVKSRLLSDVPVGCFLSSGLDSSIVATLAAKHLNRLDTFTIGFENVLDSYHGTADESAYAERYAKKLGTRHHTVQVKSDTFLNLLDDFCKYGDQPFAVSSGLGILAIAQVAQESGIKVLLSGDGADEVFGGYSWYEHLDMGFQKFRKIDNHNVSFQSVGLGIKKRLEHLKRYDAHTRAWAWHYYASESEKKKLFSKDFSLGWESSLRVFDQFNSSNAWAPEDFIKQDRSFYLPNEMLNKVDRMCMGFSVEGRSPFVAPTVLALADKLKYSYLVKDGCLKWILRKAFKDILPHAIVQRPKHGFNVPVDHWLKGEWHFLLEQTFAKDSQLYKQGFIDDNSWVIAQQMLKDPVKLNGHMLFTFIVLNRWLEG